MSRMDDPRPVWRVNVSPRFTALEMGEYMATDEGPRETFAQNMKYERLARTLTYRRVYQSVASFLSSPTRDLRILERCRKELNDELAGESDTQRSINIKHELAALATFERSLNSLPMDGVEVVRASHIGGKLLYGRMSISVRPTVTLVRHRPRATDLRGALLLDIAKGVPIKTARAAERAKEAMEYTAMLLHEYVDGQLCVQGEKPARDLCKVFHCFRQESVEPPSAYKRELRNLEAVCRQLSRDWDSIDPPASFDAAKATCRK